MSKASNFIITGTVNRYPRLPYRRIKEDILGSDHFLSLAFIGDKRARALGRAYHHTDHVPNVLSFPLSPTAGEIFIAPAAAAREAKAFSLSPDGYVAFLFIHGLLHLKGHDHGATMERLERHFVRKYRVV